MNLENFKNIAIVGLGFMGIALAKSLKSKIPNININGFDLNENLSYFLLKENIIDKNFTNLIDLVKNSNIIFLTTPTNAFEDIIKQIFKSLDKQIVVDFGSTKTKTFNTIKKIVGNKRKLFVPVHTICGGKSIDIENNLENELKRIDTNIFKNKLVHLFPDVSDVKNLDIIENIFIGLESKIDNTLTLKEHDKIYALTSHVVTFLSFLLLICLKQKKLKNLPYKYFIDKLKDKMWISIFIENIQNIEFWLKQINNLLYYDISTFALSNALKKIVIDNNFEKYVGNGYLQFIANKSKKNYCNINDFINNQNMLLHICKSKNSENLSQILLTTWQGLK